MKWAIIGIVAVVVLGGAGYAVYELTDWFEQGQDWWDEKRLENFETIALRDLDEKQKKLDKSEKDLFEFKVQLTKYIGGESFGKANFTKDGSGFLTRYGYDKEIEYLTKQGEALASALTSAESAPNAVIDADSGKLDQETMISVTLPRKDGGEFTKDLSAKQINILLSKNEVELSRNEKSLKRLNEMIAKLEAVKKEWKLTNEKQKDALDDLRQQVTAISMEMKAQEALENLDEINKAIRGEESDSELGKLIHDFEVKKADYQARKLVEADDVEAAKSEISLKDIEGPNDDTTSSVKSRFLK